MTDPQQFLSWLTEQREVSRWPLMLWVMSSAFLVVWHIRVMLLASRLLRENEQLKLALTFSGGSYRSQKGGYRLAKDAKQEAPL